MLLALQFVMLAAPHVLTPFILCSKFAEERMVQITGSEDGLAA